MAYAADAKARLLAGDYGRATVHGHEALRLAQRCESWVFAARANLRLGDAAHALGEPMRAAWYWRAGDRPLVLARRPRPLPSRQLPRSSGRAGAT